MLFKRFAHTVPAEGPPCQSISVESADQFLAGLVVTESSIVIPYFRRTGSTNATVEVRVAKYSLSGGQVSSGPVITSVPAAGGVLSVDTKQWEQTPLPDERVEPSLRRYQWISGAIVRRAVTMTLSKIFRLLMLATTASFCQQTDSGGIGYLGSGYGFPNDMRRAPLAPGKVINFYFTGIPYVPVDQADLRGEWPDELGGFALEFDTGGRVVRARIWRVQFYNICRIRDVELSRTPTCLVAMIIAQVPYDLTPANNLNSIDPQPTYLTLITPNGRSIPRSVAVSGGVLRLLPPREFVQGEEDLFSTIPYVVSPRGPDLEPGDQIIVYAYGLGTPERPVALGKPTGEPVPVPRRFVVNFHFTPGLPVLRVIPNDGERYWTLPDQVEAEPDYVGLVPDKVGVYEIRLTVPDPPRGVNLPPCDDRSPNLTVTIAGTYRGFNGQIRRTSEMTDGFRACVKPRSERK